MYYAVLHINIINADDRKVQPGSCLVLILSCCFRLSHEACVRVNFGTCLSFRLSSAQGGRNVLRLEQNEIKMD